MESLKASLTEYISAFTMYDYAAFAWLGFLFLIILTLVLLLGRKKPKLAIFLIFISILLIFVAPFGVKFFFDQTIRKVEVITDKVTKLNFAQSLIISGHLVHDGKIPYQKCHIKAKVFKIEANEYKNMLNTIKPLVIKTIVIDKNISIGEEAVFKIVFENFKYKCDYNVSLSGECY